MVKQQEFDEPRHNILYDADGLDYSVPQDDEEAAEIGIPATPEEEQRHKEAGEQVGDLLGKSNLLQQVQIVDPALQDREEWIRSMHLTQPSSGGPVRHPTPEDGRFATENMNRVRAQLTPPNPRT